MSTLWNNLGTIIGSNSDLSRRILEEYADSGLLEELLKPKPRSGREMMAKALTGRLRGDAGALSQSSRNAMEGKDIADMLQASSANVNEALKTMGGVAARIAQNGTATDADRQEYNAALDSVKSIVGNTTYNGIKLMDGKSWAADERLTVSGGSARLGIRMGAMSRNLVLHDFSDMAALDRAEDAFADPGDAADVKNTVDGLAQKASQYGQGYKGVAAGFESSAKALEKQSEIMDRAAKRSIYGSREDALSQLLSQLLGEQGNIVNRSG